MMLLMLCENRLSVILTSPDKKSSLICTIRIYRLFSCKLAEHIGFHCTDYLIHYKNAHKVIDENMADMLHGLTATDFPFWLIKDHNPGLFIRRIAAYVVTTFALSSADGVVLNILHSFAPSPSFFDCTNVK
jgi:hypothetical protein